MGNLIRMPHSELHATIEVLDALGVEPEDFERVRQDRSLAEKVAEAFASAREAAKNIFRVTVDYSRSLAEMIGAGKYDWVNFDITAEHFPITGTGKAEVNLVLVHFNRAMSTNEVLDDFKKRGLRPAKIEELLALGERYPDLQREFPIVALGSAFENPRGRRYCPFLWRVGAERGLDLRLLERGWSGSFRFLAVLES